VAAMFLNEAGRKRRGREEPGAFGAEQRCLTTGFWEPRSDDVEVREPKLRKGS